MPERIIAVESIAAAAAGWKQTSSGLPVACFALVRTIPEDTPAIQNTYIVPITSEMVGTDLVGYEIGYTEFEVNFDA